MQLLVTRRYYSPTDTGINVFIKHIESDSTHNINNNNLDTDFLFKNCDQAGHFAVEKSTYQCSLEDKQYNDGSVSK